MVAGVPVVALVQGVVIHAVEVGVAGQSVTLFPGAVHNGNHVGGHIGVLAAGTGDDHQGGVAELLGGSHQLIGVGVDVGLGQGPVLGPHAHAGTLGLVSLIEVHQILVDVQAGVLQAGDEVGHGVLVVQSAGAHAAVNRGGGSPAEDVHVGAAGQGQNAVVLQQGDALAHQLGVDLVGFGHALLGDGAAAHGQVDHGEHGSEADGVHHDDDRQAQGDQGAAADEFLLRDGQSLAGNDHRQRDDERNAQHDQMSLHAGQNVEHVLNVDG